MAALNLFELPQPEGASVVISLKDLLFGALFLKSSNLTLQF